MEWSILKSAGHAPCGVRVLGMIIFCVWIIFYDHFLRFCVQYQNFIPQENWTWLLGVSLSYYHSLLCICTFCLSLRHTMLYRELWLFPVLSCFNNQVEKNQVIDLQ